MILSRKTLNLTCSEYSSAVLLAAFDRISDLKVWNLRFCNWVLLVESTKH